MAKLLRKFMRILRNALSALTALVLISFLVTSQQRVSMWVGCSGLVLLLAWLGYKFRPRNEKYLDSRGYVVLRKYDEFEHRFIAKRFLRRRLYHNEVVHHINGRKTDNALDNLCVMDRKKHDAFHSWLRWKKIKSGEYPSLQRQKRILVDEYHGILLTEKHTSLFKQRKFNS
ncbi:HNH endonuclease [Bdellovibrio sp. GT3]|uniref:HNH endonuclease n=1 Tax=Bdellovibrio sp. GT3 TaxID=3136282 RepID=UPI0030F095F8